MKSILFISYYFPPLGGGGVQRSLKFVKYLPQYGWHPFVISSKGLISNTFDKSLVNEIPKNIKVLYLPCYSILNLKNKIKNKFLINVIHLIYYLHIPDGLFFWFFFNKKNILKVIQKNKIEVIYSTSPPNSSHLFGLYLKKKIKNIKWIADFRDEWSTNPEIKYEKNIIKNNFIKSYFNSFLEKKVIKNADKIIVVTPNTKNNFIKKYKIQNKIEIITNGYDENDFKLLNKNKNNDTLKILYYGSLYGSRHPYYFLDAFKNFIEKIKDKTKVKVDFIGSIDKKNELKSYLIENKLTNNINLIDYIDNKKLYSIAKCYNILLLFISKLHSDFIPAKLYEYMRLNIPIFAMIPLDSNAADFIKKSKTGNIVDFDDVENIEKLLIKMYLKWENKLLLKEYLNNKNWNFIEQFDRKKLTLKFSKILETL